MAYINEVLHTDYPPVSSSFLAFHHQAVDMMLESHQQIHPDAASLLAELIPALDGANIARFLSIASFTMMVYDYFLTLDEEVG